MTADQNDHTEELLYSDVVYLNTVGDDTTSQKNATITWNVQVTINKMVFLFKVDRCRSYCNAKQKHPRCKKSARPIRSSIANRCDQKL